MDKARSAKLLELPNQGSERLCVHYCLLLQQLFLLPKEYQLSLRCFDLEDLQLLVTR